MKTEREFAVKSDSYALYEAFKKECEAIGLRPIVSSPIGEIITALFLAPNSSRAGVSIFDQINLKPFNLGSQYSEALAYAKKVMEESKKKEVTYKDVVDFLLTKKECLVATSKCLLEEYQFCANLHQLEKLLAINKMMNVAAYLNPKKEKTDWSIRINQERNVVVNVGCSDMGQVRFVSKELAQQAIEILGEDVIKLALS